MPNRGKEGDGGGAQQESSEGCGFGVARRAREELEHGVLPERLGGLDPLDAEDHPVGQGEEHVADAAAVIALDDPDLAGQLPLEMEATERPVQQVVSAVVGEGLEPNLIISLRGPWTIVPKATEKAALGTSV